MREIYESAQMQRQVSAELWYKRRPDALYYVRIEGFDAVAALIASRKFVRDVGGRAFRRCKEHGRRKHREPAKARSCTTCLMLAPLAAICAVRSARPPGPIADDGGEAAETAVGDEAALDHAAEDIRIDVAAGKKENDALCRRAPGVVRKDRRRAAWRRRLPPHLFPVRRCAEWRARSVLP